MDAPKDRRRKGGKRSAEHKAQEEGGRTAWGARQPLLLLLRDMAAGGTAAAAVESALYPIDTIKTRLQAAVRGQSLKLTGLYAGIGGNLAGAIPGTALFFGVYEPVTRKLLDVLPENASGAAHFTAASCAGIAASCIRVPTEVRFSPPPCRAVGRASRRRGASGRLIAVSSARLRAATTLHPTRSRRL